MWPTSTHPHSAAARSGRTISVPMTVPVTRMPQITTCCRSSHASDVPMPSASAKPMNPVVMSAFQVAADRPAIAASDASAGAPCPTSATRSMR